MELPEHPTNEMIRAGVVELQDGLVACLDADGDMSDRDARCLVEAIWLAMVREHRGPGWVEAAPLSIHAETE